MFHLQLQNKIKTKILHKKTCKVGIWGKKKISLKLKMNSVQTPERQKRLNFDPSEREREEKSRKLTNEETKMFILFHTS